MGSIVKCLHGAHALVVWRGNGGSAPSCLVLWCSGLGGLAAGSLLQGQMWGKLSGVEGYSLSEAGGMCGVAPSVLGAACGILHMKKCWAIIALSSCLVMSLLR